MGRRRQFYGNQTTSHLKVRHCMSHPVQDGAISLSMNTEHYVGTDHHRSEFHAAVMDKEG